MTYVFRVAVINGHHNFFHYMSSLFFCELLQLFNSGEEVTSFTKFCDYVEVDVIFEHFVDLYNVWMRNSPEHVGFLDEILEIQIILPLNLFNLFNSSLLSIIFTYAFTDISEGTYMFTMINRYLLRGFCRVCSSPKTCHDSFQQSWH